MEREECTKILKALADDTRMQIFEMLRGGTLCGCKILEPLACFIRDERLDFLGDTKCRTGRTNEDTCKKNTCD